MNDLIIAVIGLAGVVITGTISYRLGNVKTQADGEHADRDDRREDFDVITQKYADIIDRLEHQIIKQQTQIEKQGEQIRQLMRERNALKRQVKQMITEIRELRISLDDFPDIDSDFVDHINELHQKIVQENDFYSE